nr:integrase, catalytic region, zinc finger, CCHC-type, peptidase aspartic, catalytic [Tanacetum cinerariifolium]
ETFKANEGEQLLDTYLCYLQVINDLKKCGYKKDNCELNYKFLNNLQSEWKQYGTLMRQTKNLMDINIDALYNILNQNQGDVNDALGYKKKVVVIKSDPLTLVAEKINVSKRKEKVVVSSDSKGSGADEFSELKKIKAKVKDYNYYKTKMLLAKKDNDKQVLLAEDQAWIESSSKSDKEINANMVFITQIEKVLSESDESSSSAKETIAEVLSESDESSSSAKETIAEVSYYTYESESEFKFETSEYYSTNYGLFVNNDDHQEIFHDAIEYASENLFENHIDSQKDYDKSEVDHNDSEGKEHLVDNQTTTFEMNNNELNGRLKVLIEKNDDLLSQTKVLQDQLKILKNPRYFEKSEDLRPSLYDEKVIGLGYTSMFLTHSNEALEIKKFKRSRENKIEFAYNYGNLNASYQTSSLKQYVPNVILEKIIIDLKDEVVSLLEKDKANMKTIESLKSKGFESSEKVISDLENQSENDCLEVEKECDKVENSKVIAPEMFKLNLDTSSSVRIPKHSGVIWKKKGSSNTFKVDLSYDSHLKLNKYVKRYSRKDLLLCNSYHLGETSGDYVCNDAMTVSCTSSMCDFLDDNNYFIFDDESVRISSIVQICLWIIDSGCSKQMTGNRALLTNFVEKFLGTVCFGNNDFAVIASYGDVVIGSMTIKKVYYIEGLGHNLFSVGQFCDKGLEVAF